MIDWTVAQQRSHTLEERDRYYSYRIINNVVFFTLTDRASTIPSNIRGCQSSTWSAGQKEIRGNIYQAPMRAKEKHKHTKRRERRQASGRKHRSPSAQHKILHNAQRSIIASTRNSNTETSYSINNIIWEAEDNGQSNISE